MRLNLSGALRACVLSVLSLSAQAAPVSGQGTWETTLQGRDLDGNPATFEAYYDTVLDITWLADANYAMTSGYDADGAMTWEQANVWAASLNVSGVTGWRLPTLGPINGTAFDYNSSADGSTDVGSNVSAPETVYAGSTASEMAYLFYNTLGNTGIVDTNGSYLGCTGPDGCLTNTGPFSNFQPAVYWSDLEFALYPNLSWTFGFGSGSQGAYSKVSELYALAVHPGDISAVPLPAAVWLFGSGLFGLLGLAGRRKR